MPYPDELYALNQIQLNGSTGNAGGGGSNGTTTLATPTNQATVPTTNQTSSSGSVAAGAIAILFANIGSSTASINGRDYPAGSTLTLPALGSKLYPSIPYNGTGTVLYITEIR
jgi:hypothetical protein